MSLLQAACIERLSRVLALGSLPRHLIISQAACVERLSRVLALGPLPHYVT